MAPPATPYQPGPADESATDSSGREGGRGAGSTLWRRQAVAEDCHLSATNIQFLAAFVLGATAGTAVFFHAAKHQIRHPSAWASFVFVAFAIGLPLYVLHARAVRRRRGQ